MKARFVRRGDFFEVRGDAAIAVARALEVVITRSRLNPGVPTVGIPAHRFDRDTAELEAAGFEVTADADGRG